MAEYIEREEIMNRLFTEYATDSKADVFELIRSIPASDVQPNKKSQWKPPLMGQGKCETYCGRCFGKIMRNSTGIFEETPFCPHCGANMRGDEK